MLFKKIELWVLILIFLIFIVFTILFGAILRDHYLGNKKLPNVQKIATFLAEIPSNIFKYKLLVKGDTPPYYFDNGAWENKTGMSYRNFDLPYGAGSCKVSWPNDTFQFEWR